MNRDSSPLAALVLVHERGGRYYDPRLGTLTDAMYLFADEHKMDLRPRYLEVPVWYFLWQPADLQCSIQLELLDERSGYKINLCPSAWVDDLKNGVRLYTTNSLCRTITLPIAKKAFLGLLMECKLQAESIKKDKWEPSIKLST